MGQFLHHTLPLSRQAAERLKLGDMVTLDGEIVVTAGIPTHERILHCIQENRKPPIDLQHAAFFHLGSYSKPSEEGFDVLYMNPTTSTRFNAMMPQIIRHFRLRCIGGKGGLDAECARALGEVGGIYLSFLGGGAPIISGAIRRIRQVAWDDLIAHYRLVAIKVEQLGPLTVAIDARGNSLYDQLAKSAAARRREILADLASARQKTAGRG